MAAPNTAISLLLLLLLWGLFLMGGFGCQLFFSVLVNTGQMCPLTSEGGGFACGGAALPKLAS